mmetsp:Transcript_46440/g.132059  ORF Transcript_46440/g.132059 Transcript_46440/m.132059 type:complete len:245 (-) Transcript_46440:502-1236(-)
MGRRAAAGRRRTTPGGDRSSRSTSPSPQSRTSRPKRLMQAATRGAAPPPLPSLTNLTSVPASKSAAWGTKPLRRPWRLPVPLLLLPPPPPSPPSPPSCTSFSGSRGGSTAAAAAATATPTPSSSGGGGGGPGPAAPKGMPYLRSSRRSALASSTGVLRKAGPAPAATCSSAQASQGVSSLEAEANEASHLIGNSTKSQGQPSCAGWKLTQKASHASVPKPALSAISALQGKRTPQRPGRPNKNR